VGHPGKSIALHGGRAGDVPTAISLHDGQGKAAAQAFHGLWALQQENLVNFLDTL
jgi:CxxC motif-containing protein (DUF1111 family)